MPTFRCTALLALALTVPLDAAVAQTTTTTPVTPNSSSATCLSRCSTQVLSCQNTCIGTINGTTVIPSVTTAGVATTPNQCQVNCSAQQQQCQRSCALVQ
jgi:hypothetical protein